MRAKPCPGCSTLIALNASTCESCWVGPEPEAEVLEAPHDLPPRTRSRSCRRDCRPTAGPNWRPLPAWRFEPALCDLDIVFACEGGAVRIRLHPEGSGDLRQKTVQWWRGLGGSRDAPVTAAEMVDRSDERTRPSAIRVRADRLTEHVECRLPDGRTFTDVRR